MYRNLQRGSYSEMPRILKLSNAFMDVIQL
jgi:hypothetical protein